MSMADSFTPEERSRVMSRVKSKNTSIEVKFRKELWKRGYRYRLHPKLPGHPDIILPKFKVAIFIDGCFWHRCPICKKTMPESNKEYWRRKIERNVERDRDNDAKLVGMGWIPIHVWEHQIKADLSLAIEETIRTVEQNQYQ